MNFPSHYHAFEFAEPFCLRHLLPLTFIVRNILNAVTNFFHPRCECFPDLFRPSFESRQDVPTNSLCFIKKVFACNFSGFQELELILQVSKVGPVLFFQLLVFCGSNFLLREFDS